MFSSFSSHFQTNKDTGTSLVSFYRFFEDANFEKKIISLRLKLSELNELKCSKSPSHMSSYAHKHVLLYLHAQTNINTRVVPNWVKFHILIYLSPLHKCPIKEGFLTSWGVKSNKKPCRQNHRLTMEIFLLP